MTPERLAEKEMLAQLLREYPTWGDAALALSAKVDTLTAQLEVVSEMYDRVHAERDRLAAENREYEKVWELARQRENDLSVGLDKLAAELATARELLEQITKQTHIRRMLDEGKCATEISNELTRMEDK